MTTYEHKRLYYATVRGEKDVLVFKTGPGPGFCSVAWVDGHLTHSEHMVTDIRGPLVLLDLNAESLRPSATPVLVWLRTGGYTNLADQIEAQTRPPKPEEPALCMRAFGSGELFGISCPDCGHTNVLHPGFMNKALEVCLVCEQVQFMESDGQLP